jgi:hypothetical protein
LIGNDLRNKPLKDWLKVTGSSITGFLRLAEDNEGKLAQSSFNIKKRKRTELFRI